VTAKASGQHKLGSHAICPGYQQRLREALRIKLEQAAEATQSSYHAISIG